MPLYVFEVLRPDGGIVTTDERDLPESSEAWGHLEVLAIQLQHQNQSDLLLRVKDVDGVIVILTGVAGAIASVERCRQLTCPIKDLLAGGAVRLGACAPCMSVPIDEVPRVDLSSLSVRLPLR